MRRSAPEPALDAGGKRSDIAEKTGVVVGVANASLSIERGAISVLMGLSGSGKSTLLRAANGLNRVTRGQVLVGDGDTVVDIGVNCDPATLRRIRRLRIAMVFQQFGLLPWRTVRDNVGLGLELRGDSPDTRRRIILGARSADPPQAAGRTAGAPGACQKDDSVRQPRSG